MRNLFYIAVIVMLGTTSVVAQSDFYATDSIREVRMYFDEPNWDHILDSLYVEDEGGRLVGDVKIDGTLLTDVGIRYKGYSSANTARVKNPFNIKLNYVNGSQEYEGFDKLKLSNVIHDPSFVREVLSYEIARKYMPASRANFANVYVNDVLLGLYSNVESVDAQFLNDYFPSNDNTFFKGNPETLNLNGENSNLSNSHGTDPLSYEPYYTQKSNDATDLDDLYGLINVLNTDFTNIETVLNVDRTLWMHALNNGMVNFDSYIGYAQNYYLYQDNSGQFNPILWDLNQSFASYHLTDNSDYWAGFTALEAPYMDPLQHYNSVSVQPRPLMRKLFEDDRYRKMYLAHLRTVMEENFDNSGYEVRAGVLQANIDTDVFADTNKFYSYADFLFNLDSTVADLIDYPGLTTLMDERSAYLSTYTGLTGAPSIASIVASPATITLGTDVWITADVADADDVILNYRFSSANTFQAVAMYDDGAHEDGAASDGTYGGKIPQPSNLIEYYLYSENDSAARFAPERAAYEFYTLYTPLVAGNLVINEVMAANTYDGEDEDGDFDDWIELFNPTAYSLCTRDLYLSDIAGTFTMWAMPELIIPSKSYVMIWADEDTKESVYHTNFKLNSEGEHVSLGYANGSIVDSISFNEQTHVTSYGRYPNATGPFVELIPTPDAVNSSPDEEVLLAESIHIFPNPAGEVTYLKLNLAGEMHLQIVGTDGRMTAQQDVIGGKMLTLDTSEYAPGCYHVKIIQDDFTETKILTVIH